MEIWKRVWGAVEDRIGFPPCLSANSLLVTLLPVGDTLEINFLKEKRLSKSSFQIFLVKNQSLY